MLHRMALQHSNSSSFTDAADLLSSDCMLPTEVEEASATSPSLIGSRSNGDDGMIIANSSCSIFDGSFLASDQQERDMTAFLEHETAVVSPEQEHSLDEHTVVGVSLEALPDPSCERAVESERDNQSVEFINAFAESSPSKPMDHILRSPNRQSSKPTRSPVRVSSNRPYSLVEERAKRFSQKPASTDLKLMNNGAMTLPALKKPMGYSADYDTNKFHSAMHFDRRVSDEPVHSKRNIQPIADVSSPEESVWSKKTACQAPPPAEVLSLPLVPISTVEVLPGIFDEQISLFERSARVEPSPERILGPISSIEEEIQCVVAANQMESVLRMPDSDLQTSTAARTGNAPRKLKAFFGDSIQVEDYVGSLGESAVDGSDNVNVSYRKEITSKVQLDAAKGRKPWVLTAKAHGSYGAHAGTPISPRPRKQQNDKEPSSSPKQKDHKAPTATPPSGASAIPSPPQPTWKDRVVNPFKRIGSGSALTVADSSSPGASVVAGVIGVPLCLCQPGTNENVPLLVELCTKIVEEKGLENQGIYRVPGNTGALNSLIEELNKDPLSLCQDNDKWQDVNVVSSLLKLFFRKLPESLITDELYNLAITANHTENSERRMLKLKKILHDLPDRNFETFNFLAQHLARVASREEVNKMDARNLAIMFGPSLVRPLDDSMVAMVRDMSDQCRIVESIILHSVWFFSSWDEDVNVPVDEETDDSTPISGSNQIMLAKAESLASSLSSSTTTTNREVHANVLQSIIQAANRKKRNKDKRSAVGASPNGDTTASSKSSKLSSALSKSKLKDKSEENLVESAETSMSSVDNLSMTSADTSEVEISFEIVRYPAYHFKDAGAYCVDNAKPRSVRRTKSNDSLLSPKLRVAKHQVHGLHDAVNSEPRTMLSSTRENVSSEKKSITLPYSSSPSYYQYIGGNSAQQEWSDEIAPVNLHIPSPQYIASVSLEEEH